MFKKILVILVILVIFTLLMPIFCLAGDKPFILSIKGLVNVELPEHIEKVTTFSDMTIVKTKNNKGFAYGSIDISEGFPKENSYNFYHNVFNKEPKTEPQKDWSDWGGMSKVIGSIKKDGFEIGLAKYPKRNVAIIYSKKMDFAVEILYPLSDKKYLEKIKQVTIKGINFE